MLLAKIDLSYWQFIILAKLATVSLLICSSCSYWLSKKGKLSLGYQIVWKSKYYKTVTSWLPPRQPTYLLEQLGRSARQNQMWGRREADYLMLSSQGNRETASLLGQDLDSWCGCDESSSVFLHFPWKGPCGGRWGLRPASRPIWTYRRGAF